MGKITKIKWNAKASMDDWGLQRKEVEGIGNDSIVRIGASDITAVTGSNKWKCPMRLFYHLTGYHNSFFITETTLAGHMMEGVTINRWESYVADDEQQSLVNTLNGIKVRKMSKANYFLLNSDYPNSFASLDYTPSGKQYSPFTGELYPKLMPVELKHTNWSYYLKWTDGCAKQYYEQIQYQMAIAGVDVALLLVLIDGVKFKVKEIYADPILQESLMLKAKEFADKVMIGKMALSGMREAEAKRDTEEYKAFLEIFESVTPELVGMDDNVELLEEIYIDSNANIKIGDDSDYYNMGQYLKCTKVMNAIENYKKLLRAKLIKSCGGFEGIEVGNRTLTNRRATNLKKAFFNVKEK